VELAEAWGGAAPEAVQVARRGEGGQGGAWLVRVGGMGQGGDIPWWTVEGCEPTCFCRLGVKNAHWL
jgi:hypothetical protein